MPTQKKQTDKQLRFPGMLRACRENVGLSQAALAKELGYSSGQFVSNWERGDSLPPMRLLPKLCKLLRTTSDSLYEAMLEDTLSRVKDNLDEEYRTVGKRRA